MNSFRKYGSPPFKAAVVHGGPGAPGEMAPVARALSAEHGVLEPLQSADSVEGQVEELRRLLEEEGDLPLALIGWSWGAWLTLILAAEHTEMVEKLILVGCGPLDDRDAGSVMKTRMARLGEEDRIKVAHLMNVLRDARGCDRNEAMARLGGLISRADSYDPMPHPNEVIQYQGDVFKKVWEQGASLRSSGRLMELAESIECPVVAVHGDYDPHPASGVLEPLSEVLGDFRFVQLEKCGHEPWHEREARQQFYDVLAEELKQV